MNRQKGLSLSTFLLWCVIVFVVAMISISIVPSFMEYQSIKSAVNRITHESGNYSSVAEVREAFRKQAEIDRIKTLTADELKINKEGAVIIISFDYDKRVKLVGNVSLLINYKWKTH
ncbi:MAG: DUF4845 domain-containing protein [Zoogloeaceae bacterium]|jgi:hypothetical protein|nr:DUF4845 domain-containing protein [Zoogloeaceae bacterium]